MQSNTDVRSIAGQWEEQSTQRESSPVCYLSNLNGKALHLHSRVSYSSYFRFHGHHLVLDDI